MKKLLPPILFMIFAAVMAFVCWAQGSPHHLPRNYSLLAIPFILLGLGLSFMGSKLFQKIGTNIMTFGEPDKLVTSGPFSWTRNPMYLGFVIALMALAALMGAAYSSFALVVLFLLITDRWYIAYEEKVMRQKFGADYDAYCQKVRRWI